MLSVKIFYLDFFPHTYFLALLINCFNEDSKQHYLKVKISSPHLFINCKARRNLLFQSMVSLEASLKRDDYTWDVVPTKSSAGLLETVKISCPRLKITQFNFTTIHPSRFWWNTFHSTTKIQQHLKHFWNCCCCCFLVFSLFFHPW